MSWKSRHQAYLKSGSWAQKRQDVFNDRGEKCEECDATDRLHVHHLTYERLGAELLSDLQVLCAGCHMANHGLGSHFTEPGGGGCFMMRDSWSARVLEMCKQDPRPVSLLYTIMDKCNGGDNWVRIDVDRIREWMKVSRSTAYRLLREDLAELEKRRFVKTRLIAKFIKGELNEVRQVITIGVKNIKALPGDEAAWKEKYTWDPTWTHAQRVAWNEKYGEDPNNGKPNPLNGGFCCEPVIPSRIQ